jgi:hypothetical protein
MNIILTDTMLRILRFDVKVFSPNTFWPYLSKFPSKWDKPQYAMTFHSSGKQKNISRRALRNLGLSGTSRDVGILASDKYLGAPIDLLRKLITDSVPITWSEKFTPSEALKHACGGRFCQAENHTRQIHYGSKLTDSTGCLLVKCPFTRQLKAATPGNVLAAIGDYDFQAIMTQLFFALIYYGEYKPDVPNIPTPNIGGSNGSKH